VAGPFNDGNASTARCGDFHPRCASVWFNRRVRRLIQGMLVVAIVLDVAYWTIWFIDRSVLASETTEAYYQFENAFPLADAWLGLACVLALVTLTRRRPAAHFWLVAAGSAGLYLFGMDLLYDLEHHILFTSAGGAVEALIVALTLAFSLTALRYAWRNRDALLAGTA
jgi:hypothetical protein